MEQHDLIPSPMNGNSSWRKRRQKKLLPRKVMGEPADKVPKVTLAKQPIGSKGKGKGKKSQVLPIQALAGVHQEEAGQIIEEVAPAKQPMGCKGKGKGKKSQILSA